MINMIPNMVTSLNLVLGMFSILATIDGNFYLSGLLIIAAMLADMSDGRVARYFKVSSEFGKELDSLCDLVSFGVAPGILAYMYMLKDFGPIGAFIAIYFAVCGALRLARFNVNTATTKGYFLGLPIPGAGCVAATFIMTGVKPVGIIFPIMMVIFASLMVSSVKYPDFKGKGEKIRIVPCILTIGLAGYILMMIPNSIFFVPFFAYAVFGILNTAFALWETRSVI